MAGPNTVEITDANFKSEVLDSSIPVLVDFWAEWCMPCVMLGPTIDKLATAYAGRAKVGKIDTDKSRDTAVKYGISSIPTVIVFKNGQVAGRFVGLQGEKALADALDAALK